jgi:hypothetical protein
LTGVQHLSTTGAAAPESCAFTPGFRDSRGTTEPPGSFLAAGGRFDAAIRGGAEMDIETIRGAIRECEAHCDGIERLIGDLLAECKPRPRRLDTRSHDLLWRLLSSLEEEMTSPPLQPDANEYDAGAARAGRRMDSHATESRDSRIDR